MGAGLVGVLPVCNFVVCVFGGLSFLVWVLGFWFLICCLCVLGLVLVVG